METQTQQQDIGQQLQSAVLQAAMPVDADSTVSNKSDGKKPEKPWNPRSGEPRPKGLAVSPRNGQPTPEPRGRQLGVKNKLTNLREAVLEAFDQVGGTQYLARLAEGTQSDRAAFVGLVAKVLPTQINANVEGGIQVQLSWLGQRNIGTTVAQPVEQVTQVVDLERDSGGKYRIKDPVDAPAGQADGGGGTEPKAAGDAQGA
jgi:hypothetical protein